jgi:hypothetical protein
MAFSKMRISAPAAGETAAEVMMHPVRIRIVNALQGRALSPREIGALLPDVPQASLYRHVARLHRAGVIAPAGEGGAERVYAVVEANTQLSHERVARAGRDEFAGYFRTFVGMLLAAFDRYVRQPAPLSPREDGVAFYAKAVHLTDDEYARLRERVVALFAEAQQNPPGAGRRRRTLAFIAVPDPEGGAADTHSESEAPE